jgi:hypothetical protein
MSSEIRTSGHEKILNIPAENLTASLMCLAVSEVFWVE